eukprot:6077699-Amphidinium_carterae.2
MRYPKKRRQVLLRVALFESGCHQRGVLVAAQEVATWADVTEACDHAMLEGKRCNKVRSSLVVANGGSCPDYKAALRYLRNSMRSCIGHGLEKVSIANLGGYRQVLPSGSIGIVDCESTLSFRNPVQLYYISGNELFNGFRALITGEGMALSRANRNAVESKGDMVNGAMTSKSMLILNGNEF